MVQRWVGAGLLDGPDEVSWEIDTATCATGATPEVIWQAEDTARWLLWRATGRRFAPEHSAAVRYFSPCPERLIELDQAFAAARAELSTFTIIDVHIARHDVTPTLARLTERIRARVS